MIKCICINDKQKPVDIPMSHWVKEGQQYGVLMIYNMVNQGAMLGVVLKEIDLESLPQEKYSCFKIDRFGFEEKDLQALLQLIEDCAELNDFDPMKLIEEQVKVEKREKEKELVEV